jgi:acyl-coenzyme A thioesterase PaaI-like protein
MKKKNRVLQLTKSPFSLKMYMLLHLPMGWIAGLKVESFSEMDVKVSVPFRFINKNPFHSVYFAVLAMAAELSSGLSAMAEVDNANVPVSMLVLNMKADFLKKAKTKITFSCKDGELIRKAISKSIETREGQVVEVTAVGTDTYGEIVANFWFSWTFKPKT